MTEKPKRMKLNFFSKCFYKIIKTKVYGNFNSETNKQKKSELLYNLIFLEIKVYQI